MLLPYFHRRFVTNICCGAYHSLAITDEGNLYGWGESRCGQLGLGRKIKEPLPKPIPMPDKVLKAAAGYQHTLVFSAKTK
jgi:alpha-tubulin suppressor-like RCC1 family protein